MLDDMHVVKHNRVMEHNTPCEDCGGTGLDAGALTWEYSACPACYGSGIEPEAELPEPPAVAWEPGLAAAPRKPAANELHPVFAEIMRGFVKGAK